MQSCFLFFPHGCCLNMIFSCLFSSKIFSKRPNALQDDSKELLDHGPQWHWQVIASEAKKTTGVFHEICWGVNLHRCFALSHLFGCFAEPIFSFEDVKRDV